MRTSTDIIDKKHSSKNRRIEILKVSNISQKNHRHFLKVTDN